MTISDLVICPETAADIDAIGEVNRQAFGQEAEAALVDRLRNGGHARVSLVAVADTKIVGHILFSHLPIVGQEATTDALALAPMAVLPSHQRLGIGSALIEEGLRRCTEQGHRIVIVLGHPEYYPRFGFSAALAQPLESPFSGEAFMAMELTSGALADVQGRVEYPPPFLEK